MPKSKAIGPYWENSGSITRTSVSVAIIEPECRSPCSMVSVFEANFINNRCTLAFRRALRRSSSTTGESSGVWWFISAP